MKMSLSSLLKERRVAETEPDKKLAQELFQLAKEDCETAEKTLGIKPR